VSGFRKDFSEGGGRLATDISKGLNSLLGQETGNPGAEGTYVQATIGTTDTSVEHDLGRTPDGWIVIDSDTNATVWRSGDKDSVQLTLSASAETNVALWIF